MTGICDALKMISGEVLFREGQIADRFYLIEQGNVLILDQAGQNVIRVYETDQLFGLPEVLAKVVWRHTAIVGSRTLIKAFPAELLFQRVEQMPLTHQDFIQDMARLGQ
jgi:CRP-like cAMP-binding protein